MYQVKNESRSEFVSVRNQRYHVRVWGKPMAGRPPLVMVHGWMDVAASYQFMVDALATKRHVIAPDWRGFGLTTGPAVDHYVMADYLADLDFLLDHYVADRPVDLLGHSMGGNVVMLYAGVRRERIRKLINLEGFGLAETRPAQAPTRYAKWMDELKKLHNGESGLRDYDDADGVAQRLIKTNPRLPSDKADWLAQHWAKQDADGRWRILGDPAHRIISANLYQLPETLALYERIEAPTLMVEAADESLSKWWQGKFTLEQFHARLKSVRNVERVVIEDAGHMLHHDQPEALARLVEQFLDRA